MKKIYLIMLAAVLVVLLVIPAQAKEWGEIRQATQNLNVREKRTVKSEHVVTLAKGQRVKVDFIKDNWGAIFNLNESVRDIKRAIGYANIKFLARVKSAKPAPAKAQGKATTVAPDGQGEVKAGVKTTPPPAPSKLGIDPSRTPVKISSDRMIYDENGKNVSFVGNVVAEHGNLTLWANKLSAYLASSSGKQFSADSIERIVAEGSVRAKRGKAEGTCGKLTYFVGEQLLKMEQGPKLQDGPNSLTGEVINFYIQQNRSEVVGGKGQRVKAVFMTPESVKVP